jgi:carbamoyl-phosphate synthase large subunit
LAGVRDRWASEGLCQVLVSDLNLVQACRDKAATCQLLERHGIPVPKYTHDATLEEAVSWANSIGFPVVLKPRDGFASQNVHIIADEEELRFFYPRTPQPIMQEFLGSQESGSEFTCAVFVNRHGSPVGTFMARRELSGGSTHHAEIGFWPEIHELLWAIGEAIRPRGMLNVQLRSTPRGPVPFELNIRCSGTSAIRAYYGFNEPEMVIRHYLLGEEIEPPEVRTGYVIRYWNEMFLDGVGFKAIQNGAGGMKGTVIAWP